MGNMKLNLSFTFDEAIALRNLMYAILDSIEGEIDNIREGLDRLDMSDLDVRKIVNQIYLAVDDFEMKCRDAKEF